MRSRLSVRGLDAAERTRLAAHAFAVASIGAAVLVQWLLDVSTSEPRFWLFHAAIAASAAAGGAMPASTAGLASFLVARLTFGASVPAGLLFLVEGALITAVVLKLRASLDQQRRRRSADEAWLRELKASQREGVVIDAALSRLDEAAAASAIVILDRTGRVADWRRGAARLYGYSAADALGESAATLFADLQEDEFARLVAEARKGAARHGGRQRRADGTAFDADVDVRPLSRGGFDGFTMIVRDLTPQKAHEAAATSTARAFAELREEAANAHQQLSTLQLVTDPGLNALAGTEFVTTLLDRLRTSIDAEGIAVVHVDRFRRRVVCAAGGLQYERGIARPPIDLRRHDSGRTLMIHNDPAGVAEMSAVGWTGDVSSLMAVPVVRGGATQAVMEVVNRTGRRATEWEIALAQVAAARIAGFLQEERYADSGAVA